MRPSRRRWAEARRAFFLTWHESVAVLEVLGIEPLVYHAALHLSYMTSAITHHKARLMIRMHWW